MTTQANIAQVAIHRTDGLYFTIEGGTFEKGPIHGTFAATVGGAALVVTIKDGEAYEAYEIRTIDMVEAILAARPPR